MEVFIHISPKIIPGTVMVLHTFCEKWVTVKIKAIRRAGFLMETEQQEDQEVKVRGRKWPANSKERKVYGRTGHNDVMAAGGGRVRGGVARKFQRKGANSADT